METKYSNLPSLEKIKIVPRANATTQTSCCTPKGNATQCCSPAKSDELPEGVCCAQPEDGSDCCNK